jgi:lipopolysaccharide transport system permease protein
MPVLVIRPSRGWVSLRLHELWDYRELLFFLGWRDVTVRYKQTVLGASWAIIQPVSTMIVFSVIFGKLARIPSDGIPYPIFSYVALLPWNFFTTALSSSSSSVVGGARMIRKVYFPRLVIPISSIVSAFIDFTIAFTVLVAMMVYYRIVPTINIVFLPLFVLLAVVSALGVGLWFAATNAKYRDVRYIIPFVTQFWMYATPIVYPSSLIPEQWRPFYAINPMVGVVEGFRWAILGSGSAPGIPMLVSVSVAVTVLVTGAFYFRRMERTFADVV